MKTKQFLSITRKCTAFFVAFGLLFASQLSNSSRAIEVAKPTGSEWLVDTGENHIWYQISESTLIIGGVGEMPDWNSGEDTPWYDDKSSITKVIINEGITKIGNNSFCGDDDKYISGIKEFVLPTTLTFIGDYAFKNNGNIVNIIIKNPTPAATGEGIFSETNEGQVFIIPASAKTAYSNAAQWGNYWMSWDEGFTNTLSAYFINLKQSDGGNISSSLEYILVDDYSPETVTLTITPDDNYFIKSLTVTDEDGTNISIENNSFTMPAKGVTVNAVFAKTGSDPETPKCPSTGAR